MGPSLEVSLRISSAHSWKPEGRCWFKETYYMRPEPVLESHLVPVLPRVPNGYSPEEAWLSAAEHREQASSLPTPVSVTLFK